MALCSRRSVLECKRVPSPRLRPSDTESRPAGRKARPPLTGGMWGYLGDAPGDVLGESLLYV